MTGSAGPLHGVRVVDISSSYAAPTASMYLGDMGAEVIKIEPVRGDDARGWGPPFLNGEAAWFLSVNRNKRSLCLDIRRAAGRDVLFRPAGVGRRVHREPQSREAREARSGPESLRERFPHLVICALSGFGLDGPDRVAGLRPHRAGPFGNDERDRRRRRAAAGQHRAVGRRRRHRRRVRDRRRARAPAAPQGWARSSTSRSSRPTWPSWRPGSRASSRATPSRVRAAAPTPSSRSTSPSRPATARSWWRSATTGSGSAPVRRWALDDAGRRPGAGDQRGTPRPPRAGRHGVPGGAARHDRGRGPRSALQAVGVPCSLINTLSEVVDDPQVGPARRSPPSTTRSRGSSAASPLRGGWRRSRTVRRLRRPPRCAVSTGGDPQ